MKDNISKIKNLFLRYREKFNSLSHYHLYRFIKTLLKSPFQSIHNGVMKVMINLTYNCHCDCDYCWCASYENKGRQELSSSEVKKIIDQIADYPSLFTLVSFIGGEPLLKEDIYQLINYAAEKGLFVEMETNGILLSESSVAKLKSAGLNHIFIRIEGSSKESHDSISKAEGCFAKAIKGIELCRSAGLSCSIFANTSKEKIYNGEIKRIIELAKALGVASIRIIYPTLSGRLIDAEERRLSAQDEAQVAGLLEPGFVYLESTHSSSRGSSRFCAALHKEFFHISCHGEVQPCPFVPLSFGNIRERGLAEIVSVMFGHPIFSKGYSGCLMNNPDFRREYILPAGLEDSYRNIVL